METPRLLTFPQKKRAVRVAITRLWVVLRVWVPARIVERRCGWVEWVAWAAGRVGKGRRSERLIKDAQR